MKIWGKAVKGLLATVVLSRFYPNIISYFNVLYYDTTFLVHRTFVRLSRESIYLVREHVMMNAATLMCRYTMTSESWVNLGHLSNSYIYTCM